MCGWNRDLYDKRTNGRLLLTACREQIRKIYQEGILMPFLFLCGYAILLT